MGLDHSVVGLNLVDLRVMFHQSVTSALSYSIEKRFGSLIINLLISVIIQICLQYRAGRNREIEKRVKKTLTGENNKI